MKKTVLLAFLMVSTLASAQAIDYNTKKGFVANGYDVVAYFDGQAVEGNKAFTATHDGVNYKFSSQDNLDKFQSSPEKFVPNMADIAPMPSQLPGKR